MGVEPLNEDVQPKTKQHNGPREGSSSATNGHTPPVSTTLLRNPQPDGESISTSTPRKRGATNHIPFPEESPVYGAARSVKSRVSFQTAYTTIEG